MARFALFTNGVKVEKLDELRENYNINDMLQNFESKALHRWLAVNHYQKELPLIENISSESIQAFVSEVFTSENIEQMTKAHTFGNSLILLL